MLLLREVLCEEPCLVFSTRVDGSNTGEKLLKPISKLSGELIIWSMRGEHCAQSIA